jgi:hypothetical protein
MHVKINHVVRAHTTDYRGHPCWHRHAVQLWKSLGQAVADAKRADLMLSFFVAEPEHQGSGQRGSLFTACWLQGATCSVTYPYVVYYCSQCTFEGHMHSALQMYVPQKTQALAPVARMATRMHSRTSWWR